MQVEIKPVTSMRDLKRFVLFPYSLFAGNPFWVPQLRAAEVQTLRWDKNPAFEFCDVAYWLALRDGKVVGRIAGIINNRYIEIWGKRTARFGYIDFIDDDRVSEALLTTVELWAKEKGMDGVHGPLGFSDLDPEGMLVEGFDEPGTMLAIHNPPYYPLQMEKNGYVKDVDWVEFEVKVPPGIHEKLKRLADVVARRHNLRVLPTRSMKDILPYIREIFYLINDAYKGLFGVVPLTEKQIDLYVSQYLKLVSHKYISVVLDGKDRIVAFAVTIPSLAKALRRSWGRLFPFGIVRILRALRRNDRADLCLIAVRPDFQGKGVNALLMHEINKVYVNSGIRMADACPELESNTRVQAQWRFFEARQHKRRRCYIKQI